MGEALGPRWREALSRVENRVSATKRKRRIPWWLCIVGALMSYTVWFMVRRVGEVAAVQDSLERAWEIDFWGGGEREGRPQMLPKALDEFVDSRLGDIFRETAGVRDYIHRERFRALFRKPIDEIHIYYPERLRGDLGAALARFPRLRRFTLSENYDFAPTEEQWTRLCTQFRSMPNLEEIELGGAWITDAAIAPLTGHPRLRVVVMTEGRLTAKCLGTFASMHNLTQLDIGAQGFAGDMWPAATEQEAIRAALPKVVVGFEFER